MKLLQSKPFAYFQSSVAKKFLMAISGLALVGFVIAHLLGNLQIFLGPDVFNHYAATIQSMGDLLWVARIGLLGMVVLHVVTAVQLTIENRKARPVAYQSKDYTVATYASRTMPITGLIVLSYIVYHLLHFTVHAIYPQYAQMVDSKGRHDVYSMVVLGFQHLPVVIFYLIGNGLLGMHLSHGLYSLFQSLGATRSDARPYLKTISMLIGWGIFVGFASIPISAYLGVIGGGCVSCH